MQQSCKDSDYSSSRAGTTPSLSVKPEERLMHYCAGRAEGEGAGGAE